MKRLLNIVVLVAVMMTMSVSTFAQKFGYINSGNLLELLPETKAAQDQLTTYTKQLQNAMDANVAAFQAKVKKFQETDPSTITPKEYEAMQKALVEEETALRKEAQANELKVAEKREELLRPIFTKADNAIKEVGKELGYDMIFDSSVFNIILFAEDSVDIMDEVKKKLGIQ